MSLAGRHLEEAARRFSGLLPGYRTFLTTLRDAKEAFIVPNRVTLVKK
jgi:hypothetical protein